MAHENHTIRFGIRSKGPQTSKFDPIGNRENRGFKGKKHGPIPHVRVPFFSCELLPLLHNGREGRPILTTFENYNIFGSFPDCFCGFEVRPFRQERVYKRIRSCRFLQVSVNSVANPTG
jgi:hypothetical protein